MEGKAEHYLRQYLGVVTEDGRRIVYVNGFHRHSAVDMSQFDGMSSVADSLFLTARLDPRWRTTAWVVYDGGRGFFGAEYDPATGEIIDFQFNGPPDPLSHRLASASNETGLAANAGPGSFLHPSPCAVDPAAPRSHASAGRTGNSLPLSDKPFRAAARASRFSTSGAEMASYYYVNDNAQDNGDHEVHISGCDFMPSERTGLGYFVHCAGAVQEARKHHRQTNGCIHCCPECHTQ